MAVTPNYSIPYPALTDAPNGPAQMQALATQVDTVLFNTNNPPLCICYALVLQSIPNNAWTPLTFTANRVDTVAGHSTSSNTSRYTAQTGWAGWYRVMVIGTLAEGAGSANPAVGIAVNGTKITGSVAGSAPVTGPNSAAAITSMLVFLNVGDYVEGHLYQNSGGALNTLVTATDFCPSMQIEWRHP